jgi:hypothetical protein
MPIYEYKGQQYDIATEDQAAAKAKILSYLEKQGGTSAAPASAAPAATSTAEQNRAEAQARQDIASQGPEQISIPQAELAEAERNAAALRRELARKGVDVGPPSAIGSTKAGDFLLAKGAEAQSQRPAPAAAVVPPAPPVAQTQLTPPPAPPVTQTQLAPPPKPVVAGRFGAAGVGPAAAARVVPTPPSVLEKAPKVVPVVSETQAALNMAGVSPKYVNSLEAEFYQLPIEQRAAALQQAMVENPENTVKGRAVRAVAARHADWVKAASKLPKSTALVDPRREAVNARLAVAQGQLEREQAQAAKAAEARAKLRAEAAAEEYGPLTAAEDTGLSIVKGLVNLSESATGIANIFSFGTVGKILAKTGYYDPEGANKFYTGLQSGTSRDQQQNVQEAKGFVNSLKAIAVNPAALLDSVVSSLPSMVASGTGGGMLVKQLMTKAAAEAAALKLTGEAATKFVADKVKSQTLKIVAATSAGEGVLTAGSVAEAGRQNDKDWNTYVLPALAAGLGNVAINMVGGKVAAKYGIGDVQTSMATRMAGLKDVGLDTGAPAVQVFKELAKEGLLEEMPQSYQEQIFRNLATGRPWDEGVDEAAAQGLVAGIAMAGGHKASSKVLRATSSLGSAAEGKIGEAKEGLRESMSKILGVAKTNELLGLREGAYEAPGRVSPAKLMAEARRVPFASSSGSLNVPPAEKAAAEPKLGNLENVGMQEEEEPGLGDLENVQARDEPPLAKAEEVAAEAAPSTEETRARVNAIAENLQVMGVSGPRARRMAEKQVAEEQAKGAKDAARTEPPPSGESVSVAGQPRTETTGGPEAPARDGVVSTESDAGLAPTGEAPKPAALTETKAEEGTTDGTETVETKQAETQEQEAPAAVGFRPLKEGEKAATGVRNEVFDIGNGNKIGFASNGDGFIGTPESTDVGVIRIRDTRGGAVNKPSNFPDFVPESLRQPLLDYHQARLDDYYDNNEKSKAAADAARTKLEQAAAALNPKVETKVETPAVEEDKAYADIEAELAAVGNDISDLLKYFDKQIDDLDAVKAEAKVETEAKAEAPAAPKPPKAAKPGKEVHTVAQGAEGKWSHAINGNVVNTYATKRQAIAAELLYKAKKAGNAENIAQRQKAFDDAMSAPGKGRPLKPVEAGDKQELAELESALKTYDSPASNNGQIRASAQYIRDIANDPTTPPAVRKRAQQMLKEEVDPKDIPKSSGSLSIQAAEGKKDLAFSTFTTSSQTLSHIIKTGTDFQRRLARRLRSTVRNVRMVVVEKGQELPSTLAKVKGKWDRCLALYSPEEKGVVYTKGESYGRTNGLNAVVQLHELFHGATSQKIRTALAYMSKGRHLDSQMVTAVKGLQKIMDLARAELNKQIADGTADPHVHSLALYGEALTNLHEFVSYGNTDAKLQEFLQGVKGFEKDESLFSPFVDSLRRMIGVEKEDANALSDLIQHTDQLISSRTPGGWGYAGDETLASAALPPTPQEQAEDARRAREATITSRDGDELARATSVMASLRDPRYLWREIKRLWPSMSQKARVGTSHFYDSEALAYGGPGDVITGLQDAHEAIMRLTGAKDTYMRGVARISEDIVDFFRAEPKKRAAFEDLVNESTLARYDPSNPAAGRANPGLDAAYAELGEKGQKLYQKLRDYYKAMNMVKQQLLEENLDKLDLPVEAREKLMAGIRLAFEDEKIEPYFPLARFGPFVLEVTEPGKEKASYRFDTYAERERAAGEYAAQQGRSVASLMRDGVLLKDTDTDGGKLRARVEKSSTILQEAYAAIDSASMGDVGAKQQIKDALYQAYLAAMPENSVRKFFIHRKGTPGFSPDVLRAVNDIGSRMARSFAHLEHAADIRQALDLAGRQKANNDTYAPFVERMEEFASEALEPEVPPSIGKFLADTAAGGIAKISFIRNLTSWSSAIMQPTDIILKGIPIMTGNHGAKAAVELAKMGKLFTQFGVLEKMPDGTTRFRPPSIEFAKGLTDTERKAVRDMVDIYGVTENTLTNDIFARASKATVDVDSKAWQMGKDAVDTLIFGGLMHHSERLSREVIALTSFRLHLAEQEKANPGNLANYHEAVKQAVRETNEILGNYNPNNKPMLMRGAGGKILGMYKFFPFITTKLLIGNFFKMLPMFNKQGKVAAATKFFGILGTHALFGGLVALPAFSMVMGALKAAWEEWQKDPDAPTEMRDVDYETWWRTEWLPSYFGNTGLPELAEKMGIKGDKEETTAQKLARLAEHGVLNYLTGWDFSSRLSLNDMWFREPQPGKNARDTLGNWAEVVAGPAWSTAKGIAQGMELWSQGEYEKGLEKWMPASISKLMLAHRYNQEGVRIPDGPADKQLVEKGKIPTSALVGQVIGYAPEALSSAQTKGFKAAAAEKVVDMQKASIIANYKKAFLASQDDSISPEKRARFEERMQKAEDDRQAFNERNPRKKISSTADLREEAKGKRKESRLAAEDTGGINITRENADLLDPLAESAARDLQRLNKSK